MAIGGVGSQLIEVPPQDQEPNPVFEVEEEDGSTEDDSLFADYGRRERGCVVDLPRDNRESRRWEVGLKIDSPEFHGSLQAEEFLDLVNIVEEILVFKEVLENKQVSLVALRFRGQTSAWWQQLKRTRYRLGKAKITSWGKLKKHMREAFWLYNYTTLLYQRLQNLRQGNKSIDDYTKEFYQLITRNDLGERTELMVSRYIGGLRQNFLDTLNLFDVSTVTEAHQRAITLVKQQGGRGSLSSVRMYNNSTTTRPPIQQGSLKKFTVGGQPNRTIAPGSEFKCFKCRELGHRVSDCKKGRSLFVESEEPMDETIVDMDHGPLFDQEYEKGPWEELVEVYHGANLAVRHICLAPRTPDGK